MPRKKKESAAGRVRITQVKSGIGRPTKHRATLTALGLGRPRASAVHVDAPSIRGMIFQVRHLVEVEELEGGEE